MAPLSRQARPLLSMVAGKPHASSDDHVETADYSTPRMDDTEEDIHREPISSDEEDKPITSQNSPPIVPTSPPMSKTKTQYSTARRKKEPFVAADPALKKPARPRRIPAPRTGSSAKTRGGLRAEEEDDEKENRRASSSQSPSGSTKRAAEPDNNPELFDSWAHGSSQSNKARTTFTNIHAPTGVGKQKPKPVVKQRTFAGVRDGYVDSTRNRMNLSKDYEQYKGGKAGKEDSSELSEVDLLPVEGSLRAPKKSKFEPSSQQSTASVSNLDELAEYRSNPTCTVKTDPLALKEISSPLSSLPQSPVLESAPPHPRDSLENAADLQQYFQNLPTKDSDDRCPLCDEPVPQKLYWDWWKGKTHTVRQRQFFCHEHQKREAQDVYNRRGYPEVDWKRLPAKVKEHHPRLVAILRNEIDDRPSSYREAHRERMLDNERPTVKSLMRHEELLESKTGYYGGRGRRAMMDIITSQLADTIRECVETDEVVAWGGMANFVQRVLVPELAIQLVMQDMQVSEKVAKEIIEESREVGCLVHEEEEDKVHFVDDEDEEDVIDVLDIEV